MNIKAYLNNEEIEINTGFTIIEELSEDLDTSTVIIPFKPKTTFHRMDNFEIHIDDEVFTFIVGDINSSLADYDDKLYNYTLSLISETFKLQKLPLPNLSITALFAENKKSTLTYLTHYQDIYIKPKYIELNLSQDLKTLTSNVDAPEMQWNEPTMYEVINSLIAPLNSLVKVKKHQITYLDITKKNNPIDTSKLFYTLENKSLNDYTSEIQVEAQNAVTPYINTTSYFYVTPRNNEAAAVTTDDLKIVLDKPIYKIQRVYVNIFCNLTTELAGSYSPRLLSRDITDHVVEESVYNTLKLTNQALVIDSLDYKRNNIYFTEGQNELKGLSFNENTFFGIESPYNAIQNIILSEFKKDYPYGDIQFSDDIRDIRFYVEYITLDNAKFVVNKEQKHYSGLVDHQSESYVDADQFGKNEELTLKRLGNPQETIYGCYDNIKDCPKLGDYIGDYILAHRELNVFNDYILFKGIMYKDYVMRDLFYGINAKKRNTQIATGADALLRTDVVKYDCEFTTDEYPTENDPYLRFANYLLKGINLANDDTLDNLNVTNNWYNTLNLKMSSIQTTYESGDQSEILRVMPAIYKVSKNIIFTFKCYDNFSVGMYIDDTAQVGGYGQQYARYVDENGEFKTLEYTLFESVNPYYSQHPENPTDETAEQMNTYWTSISQQLPILRYGFQQALSVTRIALQDSITLYKDNREITSVSLQFKYKSSNEDEIIIYDEMLNQCPMLQFRTTRTSGRVWLSYDEKYTAQTTEPLGTEIFDEIEIDYSNIHEWMTGGRQDKYLTNYIKLFIKDESTLNLDRVQAWAFVLGGKILFAVNKLDSKSVVADKVYLKISKN